MKFSNMIVNYMHSLKKKDLENDYDGLKKGYGHYDAFRDDCRRSIDLNVNLRLFNERLHFLEERYCKDIYDDLCSMEDKESSVLSGEEIKYYKDLFGEFFK